METKPAVGFVTTVCVEAKPAVDCVTYCRYGDQAASTRTSTRSSDRRTHARLSYVSRRLLCPRGDRISACARATSSASTGPTGVRLAGRPCRVSGGSRHSVTSSTRSLETSLPARRYTSRRQRWARRPAASIPIQLFSVRTLLKYLPNHNCNRVVMVTMMMTISRNSNHNHKSLMQYY